MLDIKIGMKQMLLWIYFRCRNEVEELLKIIYRKFEFRIFRIQRINMIYYFGFLYYNLLKIYSVMLLRILYLRIGMIFILYYFVQKKIYIK